MLMTEMRLLDADRGLSVWSATKHRSQSVQYRWVADLRGGFAISDLPARGYGRWCEHCGFSLYIRRDLEKFTQAYVVAVKEPATVIWCERSTTLRLVLRRLAREYGGEVPEGFKLFAKECRSACAGWR